MHFRDAGNWTDSPVRGGSGPQQAFPSEDLPLSSGHRKPNTLSWASTQGKKRVSHGQLTSETS